MYESYFGFEEKPFSLLPDPRFLFLGKKHSQALAMLRYGIETMAGFVVITGDIGAGKTTLVRKLLGEIHDDATVGLITNTHYSFGILLHWILSSFSLDHKDKIEAECYQMLAEFLVEQYAQSRKTIIIIDEAQNLDTTKLEELRVISNLNADQHQIVQIVLVGQPNLRDNLKRPELVQFAQRIVVDYHLTSLESKEVEAYIKQRLHIAGSESPIFTRAAVEVVAEYSGGVPRLINILCDTGLVYAFAAEQRKVDSSLMHEVISDKLATGLLPIHEKASPVMEVDQDLVRFRKTAADNRKIVSAKNYRPDKESVHRPKNERSSSLEELKEQIAQLRENIDRSIK
jgi:type II secretory pathway predicted ATPase ExeA